MRALFYKGLCLVSAIALTGCGGSSTPNSDVADAPASTQETITADPLSDNIAHIGFGGIVLDESNQEARPSSEWAINLIDGGIAGGWVSGDTNSSPHVQIFELAGLGRIEGFTLDSRIVEGLSESGSLMNAPKGSPLKSFEILASTDAVDGAFVSVVSGQLYSDARQYFPLNEAIEARWIQLVLKENWGGSERTRLSEFEVNGELISYVNPPASELSGVFKTGYGEIFLRQTDDVVRACYHGGLGQMRGVRNGRVLRMSFLEEHNNSAGPAVLVYANETLFGFWYKADGKMGGPWNAKKIAALTSDNAGECREALYPD